MMTFVDGRQLARGVVFSVSDDWARSRSESYLAASAELGDLQFLDHRGSGME